MKSFIDQAFQKSYDNIHVLTQSEELKQSLVRATELIVASYESGGQLLAAGNGGSASDAQHLIAELVVKLGPDRSPIRGIALSTDTSILTAVGNDYGYDYIFSRQVFAHMRPQDVFLGITTSGNSPNIIQALKAVKSVGGKSILLSGKDGGKCREHADICILAPGDVTNRIQECHIIIYHTLCFLIEKGLADKGIIKFSDKKI